MIETQNYILTGGRVVDPSRGIDGIMDIGISEGRICAPESVKDPVRIDVAGFVVAPGFIDIHVHLRQPGRADCETVRTGTMAAAAGGFTTVVAMPNTTPVADSPSTIEYIRSHVEREGVVKVLPCGAMTKNSEGKEMAGIGGLKSAGVVAISDDGKCVQNHDIMRHIVQYAKSFGLPILDHCQEETLASGGVMHEGYWSTLLGMKGMPSAAEELIVARNIVLARNIDWKIHIQHVSCKESIALIRQARAEGIQISAEATPHHISLTDETIKKFDTNYKMNPPLRSEEDRLALIEGLRDGTITVIATDHAPHTQTDKLVEFDYAPFGIIGLETALPVCFTELYHKGILDISSFVSKFTKGPAEILGLPIGTLAEGSDADITILDPDCEHVIDINSFYSKSRNNPYHGYKAKGKAVAVLVNGEFVFNTMQD